VPTYVWDTWCTTATSTSSTDPWGYWTANTSVTTASSTTLAWNAWTSTTSNYQVAYTPPARTPEQIEAQRRERERLDAQRRENVASRQAAERRALELLESMLDDDQLAEWREHQRFHVRSQRGLRYCIHRGRQHNVFLVDDDGRRLVEYCGHVRDAVPDEDNVLAQKLLLEHDEETFLGIANRWKLADHPLADAELAVPRQVGTGTRVAA
jgi:hypothetical protein